MSTVRQLGSSGVRQVILDPLDPVSKDPDGSDVHAVILKRALRYIASGALLADWQDDDYHRIAKAKRSGNFKSAPRSDACYPWLVFRRALIYAIHDTRADISRLHTGIDWQVRCTAMNGMLSQVWHIVSKDEEVTQLCERVAAQRREQKIATAAAFRQIMLQS